MANSNVSAVEQQVSSEGVPKSENAHRSQVGHILTQISGFGKAISNCQNSRKNRQENISFTHIFTQTKKTYLVHVFTAAS